MAVRALIAVMLLVTSLSAIALDAPYLSGRVNDQAGLVTAEVTRQIEEKLETLENASGAQVAVLTIPTLKDDALEAFSMRVVETWKLGQRGKDNGVLILVVKDDRKIRIEVGYGLEGVLTDLSSRRIIDFLMVPAFKEGDFGKGILAAVNAVSDTIRGDTSAIPEAVAVTGGSNRVMEFIFLGIFAIMISPFAFFSLALKGSGGWFLYLFLIPFFYLFPMIAGEGVALIGAGSWMVAGGLLRLLWPGKWQIDPKDEKGIPAGTSSSGGGYRGKFSSGGGFSGGGGSFGGGGASGSW